ncbi:MAG TPA: DNRLRE domain-containing protein [Ignavibacteriaceae bacterium]|nr:DNRLRE domain-containing protein [Ignavibacteriaceae bacterium]
MTYKKIFLFPILLLSMMFYSCSDSPSSIGNNILSPDFVSVHKIDSSTDSVQQASTYYKTRVRLSDSPRLFLGKYANVEASTLIKFAVVVTDTGLKNAILNSTLNVISSKVNLTRVYNIGDTSSIIYSVHKVNNYWTALYNADSSSLEYDPGDISSNKSSTDSLYSFDLDNQTVLNWLHSAADTSDKSNHGIYLSPDPASNGIVGFDAYNVNAVGLPRLTIVVSVSGNVDTLSYISLPDVSIISGNLPVVPAEDIVVQAGLAVDSWVKFDLSSIKKGSVINKAQLTLYLDSSATKTGDKFTNALIVYFSKDTSAHSYDTTSAIVLNRSANYFTGNIAPFVQSIVSGFHENQGFVLGAGGPNTGVELFALKGSGSETSLRPRLVITYTGRK